MKKLFYLIMFVLIVFIVSSIFKGGEYIRLISAKTGVDLAPVAQIADTLSLGDFMKSHSRQSVEKQKQRGGN
jgi:hypothetical protein